MTRIRVVGLLLTSSLLLASPLALAKKKKNAEFVPEEAASGVVTHSSGNHGAALAYAARRRAIPAFVVMPENGSKVKQENVRRFGATIRDRDAAID